jgi:hypothetical protein
MEIAIVARMRKTAFWSLLSLQYDPRRQKRSA